MPHVCVAHPCGFSAVCKVAHHPQKYVIGTIDFGTPRPPIVCSQYNGILQGHGQRHWQCTLKISGPHWMCDQGRECQTERLCPHEAAIATSRFSLKTKLVSVANNVPWCAGSILEAYLPNCEVCLFLGANCPSGLLLLPKCLSLALLTISPPWWARGILDERMHAECFEVLPRSLLYLPGRLNGPAWEGIDVVGQDIARRV